jgi:hypothetical protein
MFHHAISVVTARGRTEDSYHLRWFSETIGPSINF